ncbi:transposase [Candidatus Saganbacteria bacterium]|nr:transposase [Candidatus Saganbacteria bacterium]
MKKLPKRKNPRLKGYDYTTHGYYFITTNTKHRIPRFTNDAFNKQVIDCLIEEQKRTGFRVYAYCLMPDHMHLLLSAPGNEISVSDFVGGFKSKSTKVAWSFGINGKLWQGCFHDRILWPQGASQSFSRIAKYIFNNPVKKGLVKSWDKWPYSGRALIEGQPQGLSELGL